MRRAGLRICSALAWAQSASRAMRSLASAMLDASLQPVAQLVLHPSGVLRGELKHRRLKLCHEVDTAPVSQRHLFFRGAHDVAPINEGRQKFWRRVRQGTGLGAAGKSVGTATHSLEQAYRPQGWQRHVEVCASNDVAVIELRNPENAVFAITLTKE